MTIPNSMPTPRPTRLRPAIHGDRQDAMPGPQRLPNCALNSNAGVSRAAIPHSTTYSNKRNAGCAAHE